MALLYHFHDYGRKSFFLSDTPQGSMRLGVKKVWPGKKCFPWEPTALIFKGYNPYFSGVKPSFLMVLGANGCSLIKLVEEGYQGPFI